MLKQLTALGYRRTSMSRCGFRGLPNDIQTIDFSGWPMIVHADMSNELAYALCEAIELRKDAIPTDNFKPLSLKQLCAMTTKRPSTCRFIRRAKRFYRERGFLK